MSPQIAVLIVGHPDYPNAIGEEYAGQAIAALRQAGVNAALSGPSCTEPVGAGAAARALLKSDPEGVILFIATWLECSTALAAIREFEHLPFALWAIPMFDRDGQRESTGSFVAACALKGALRRMEYRFKTIIGLPECDDAVQRAVAFSRAAHATERLKRFRLGLVGYSAMSIYPGTFDHVLLRRHIGPEVVHLDTYTLLEQVKSTGAEAIREAVARVRRCCAIEVGEERLEKAAGLAAAAAELVAKHQLHAINVKCQYELSQGYGMTACVPMALLADQGVVASCEGDVMVTVSQALLHLLTGLTTTYGDVLDLQGRRMLISSCGFAPFSMADRDHPRCIRELDYPGFDGIICSFTLRRGPVTFARLAEGRGDYHLVYGLGHGVETDLRQGRFPALQVELEGDPAHLLESIPSQHFALCEGHLAEELEDACRILGVKSIRM